MGAHLSISPPSVFDEIYGIYLFDIENLRDLKFLRSSKTVRELNGLCNNTVEINCRQDCILDREKKFHVAYPFSDRTDDPIPRITAMPVMPWMTRLISENLLTLLDSEA